MYNLGTFDNAKMSLSSLPLELLLFIPPNLQYASEFNAMSQTCRRFYTIFNPKLYSRFANSCEPNILRLVETGNSDALHKLVSAGYRLFDFLETPQDWWNDCDTFEIEINLQFKSSMIIAARNGHLEILQIFIDNLPSIITRSAIRSQHLLRHAALRGQLDVVKFLIAQGALVNYIDELGGTHSILQSAVVGGHVPVAKYIIEETECQDLSQDSAFHLLWCAIKEGHLEMVKYLLKCGASFTY